MDNTRSIAAVVLVVSILLVCAVSWFSHEAWQSVVTSAQSVSHTVEVAAEAEGVLSDLKDIAMGQRGYLLTGREFYLAPFEIGRQRVQGDLSRLRSLTQDNAVQTANLARLKVLIHQRLEIIDQTVVLARAGKREEAIALVATDRGEKIAEQIRALGKEIRAEEDRLLVLRRAHLDRDIKRNRWSAIIITAIHISFLIAVAFLLWRLQRAQAYLRVCAWSKTVEHDGQWITFEDYLRRRFKMDVSHGINPEQAQKLMMQAQERA